VADTAGVGEATVGAVAAGVGLGENLGRVLGVALAAAAGVALAAAAAVALGAAATVGEGLGLVVIVAAGVALAAAGADTAGVVAAVAAGVAGAVELSSGFTNVFDGALGGGVDSVRIFVRARSAAERSAMVQPLSMFISITRSLMRRGRGISGSGRIAGSDISSSSPRIVSRLY
jgi:hypothetical protein